MSDKIINESTYYLVCGALLVCTLSTYIVARFDLGWLNLPIAILIAAAKGTLIILFTLTLSDYLTRFPTM